MTPDIICKTMQEYRDLPITYGKVIQVPWAALEEVGVITDGRLAELIHNDLEEERVAALEDDYVPVP